MIFSSIQINVVVSGALDRLHSEKDPCVKYDVNRKLWIYLHRSRSEEEFGKAKNVVIHSVKMIFLLCLYSIICIAPWSVGWYRLIL